MTTDSQFVLYLPDAEFWNEDTNTFHNITKKTVVLEHSLYTISKWERIWHKCFLKHADKMSLKETLSYIRCMVIEPENISDDDIIYIINDKQSYNLIQRYMHDSMSATYIRQSTGPKMPDSEAKTAELLYYYLIKLQIPVDVFEHWHINRLLVLINVFNIKDDTKHKRSVKEIMRDNNKINEERKKKLGSKG